MKRKYTKESEKYFLIGLTLIFVILTLLILNDIYFLIIYSILLSYFLFPVYKFYLARFSDKRISSLLALITATVLVFVPLALMSYFVILSLIKILVEYRLYIENPEILNGVISGFFERFTNSTVLSSIDFSAVFNKFVLFVIQISTDFFSSIPIMIFYFFITLFLSYYILIYHEEILLTINDFIPLSLKKQKEILGNVQKNIKVLFRGYFLTGIIQTIVALIGYIAFGAPNLLLITTITLMVSLVPYLGTPLVWIPVSIYMVFTGNEFGGIGLFIYGTLIISTIDNFVRPVLMSDKDTISPPLVFIGFIGGLFVFGIPGIILGPIIISITAILLRYLKEYYIVKD